MDSQTISGSVLLHSGPLAGRIFRAELHELQKADRARKYARKDRRPLDPPPVVQLKLIQVLPTGAYPVTEIHKPIEPDEYDDFTSFGFLCHVDLFPVPEVECDGGGQQHAIVSPLSSGNLVSSFNNFSPANHSSSSSVQSNPPLAQDDLFFHAKSQWFQTDTPQLLPTPTISLPTNTGLRPPLSSQILCAPTQSLPQQHKRGRESNLAMHAATDVVGTMGDYVLTESSKRTNQLSGATVVCACTLEHHGENAMMFVFSDVAVKVEGTFCLRFRAFNIFSACDPGNAMPVLAECFSGPFRVYSTKDFPGLRASTALTKQISMHGISLNARESVRKRRRKSKADDGEASRPAPL